MAGLYNYCPCAQRSIVQIWPRWETQPCCKQHFQFTSYSHIFLSNHADFVDFTSGQMEINPPNIFAPNDFFSIEIIGDNIIEPNETIVVTLSSPKYVMVEEPFVSNKTGPPEVSSVNLPDIDRVILSLRSTEFIIADKSSEYMRIVTS